MNAAATKSPAVKVANEKVRIYGPNLSGAAQQLGSIHVHAHDCAECQKYGARKPNGGETHMARPRVVSSKREVVMFVYEDQINEGSDYDACREDVWMDCECLAGLPEEAPAPAPVVELPVAPAAKPAAKEREIANAYKATAKSIAERIQKRWGNGWNLISEQMRAALVDQEMFTVVMTQAPSNSLADAQEHVRTLRNAVYAQLGLE